MVVGTDEDGGSAVGLAGALLGVLAVAGALVLATAPALADPPAGAEGCTFGTRSTAFGPVCAEAPVGR